MAESEGRRETVTVGGGCFWCTEAVLSELRGVRSVLPGYAGGNVPNPSYESVCTGRTGHAEVVEVEFDPSQIPLADLLKVFFATHDPTTLNRQGADVGTQYRSIILYRTPEQRATAEAEAKAAAELWEAPVVTKIEPFSAFYPAEEYHRRYFERNPGQGYCRAVIAPKVVKFRKEFAARLRSAPPAAGR